MQACRVSEGGIIKSQACSGAAHSTWMCMEQCFCCLSRSCFGFAFALLWSWPMVVVLFEAFDKLLLTAGDRNRASKMHTLQLTDR